MELESLADELPSDLKALTGISHEEFQRLTRREREVVARLRSGIAPKQIAAALFISDHTIRNHVKAVYRKLGVHSHLELMRYLRG